MKRKHVVILAASMLLAGPASAAMILTLSEADGNVVLTGSGTVDMAGLSPVMNATEGSYASPNPAVLRCSSGTYRYYTGISGPTSMGTGTTGVEGSTSTGDSFGMWRDWYLYLPVGYVSGAPIAGSATWSDCTLSTLGFEEGTYVYTWGNGENADSMTVNIVPEPATMGLLALGGVTLLRRRK